MYDLYCIEIFFLNMNVSFDIFQKDGNIIRIYQIVDVFCRIFVRLLRIMVDLVRSFIGIFLLMIYCNSLVEKYISYLVNQREYII